MNHSSKFVVIIAMFCCIACGNGNGSSSDSSSDTTSAADINTDAAAAALQATGLMMFTAIGAVGGITIDISDTSSLQGLSLEDDPFTCTQNQDNENRADCTCAGGGTVTTIFSDTVSQTACGSGGEQIVGTVDSMASVTYSNCVVDHCGDQVTIDGEEMVDITFVVDQCTPTIEFDINVQTSDDCSGITVTNSEGTLDLGYNTDFDVLLEADTDTFTLTGGFCVGETNFNFESLDQVEDFLLPNENCDGTILDEGGPTTISCDQTIQVSDVATAVTVLNSLDTSPLSDAAKDALNAACDASSTDVSIFIQTVLCQLSIDPALAVSGSVFSEINELEGLDLTDLETSCTALSS